MKQSIDDLVKLVAELSDNLFSGEVTFKVSCEVRTYLIVELGEASSEARSLAQSRAGPFLLQAKLGMKFLAKL